MWRLEPCTWSTNMSTVFIDSCLPQKLKRSSSDGPRRSITSMLYSFSIPNHLQQTTMCCKTQNDPTKCYLDLTSNVDSYKTATTHFTSYATNSRNITILLGAQGYPAHLDPRVVVIVTSLSVIICQVRVVTFDWRKSVTLSYLQSLTVMTCCPMSANNPSNSMRSCKCSD